MAHLRPLTTTSSSSDAAPEEGLPHPLRSVHLIGRTAPSNLCLQDPKVSSAHARLRWTGAGWELRDLGSTNGTFVDGKLLKTGDARLVPGGARLSFGSAGQVWVLADAGPPAPFAVPVAGGPAVEGAGELLALPSAEAPELSVWGDAIGRWMVEREGELLPAGDLQELTAGGQTWRLHLPQPVEGTLNADAGPVERAGLRLQFGVSSDEEHVELRAEQGGRGWDLKARAHHYLLLTLARAWAQDAEDGDLPPGERGWVYQDELSKRLRMDDNGIYLAVFRARKQLTEAGVPGANDIIERRVGTRQLRIGASAVSIRSL